MAISVTINCLLVEYLLFSFSCLIKSSRLFVIFINITKYPSSLSQMA